MPPSCITEAQDAMKVTTEDKDILAARRTVLRLLLADHTFDCLRCRANLNCELQKLTEELGVREHGLIPVLREGTVDESSPVFVRDMNRCVRCARCIRTCQEILGLGAIDFIGRGHTMEVGPFANQPIRESICEACGECVVRCPTGALALRREIPRAEKKASVICPYCGTGCGIELHVRRGKAIAASGDRQNPVNRGVLCVKGRSGSFDFLNHPDRLGKPLVRKDGELRESTWEEALSLVAEKFAMYRGDAFAAFSSAKVANEDNYLMQRFVREVQGSNNVDHCARL
jgi:predicted molibdopterin-dependent oxidoreductase YjgC